MNFEFLTPKMIVDELNKYIVGQYEAKKAVAIALRNRIRRMKLPEKMRKEVIPKNILMIGPTGVGKTEIARRLAQIADAPFIKVEATRFTEVGYVGKNVDSMIRELVDVSVNMVKNEMIEKVKKKAEELVIDKLTDIILSGGKPKRGHRQEDMMMEFFQQIFSGMQSRQSKYTQPPQENQPQRDEIKRRLIRGDFDEMEIEIDVEEKNVPMVAGLGPELEDMGIQLGEMFSSLLPKRKVRRRMKVKEAKKLLLPMEAEKLIDMDKVVREGIERAQNRGIIFIDEIDKVASRGSKAGPDVSREGVQRDLLPIVEGTTIMTKYGPVRTDYILFIAAGAFHTSKPSDLIPELQGRFPIRVELNALTKEDFIRILTEPENAIIKQYKALLETEDVELEFTDDGIEEIAEIAFQLNEKMENIGARRLYTVVEKVMEDISFNAPFGERKKIIVDKEYVRKRLHSLLSDKEEIFYIL